MTTKRPTGRALRAVSTIALLASAAVGSSCAFSGETIDDHWTFDSVPPRIARSVLGYDGSRESSYKDFAWDRKKSNSLSIRRYLLNHNPENPNQRELPSLYEPRPMNSLAPNPWNYIHIEGILLGWVTTGVPIPIPIDSIIGTFEEGGLEEFRAGFTEGLGGNSKSTEHLPIYDENGELPPFKMTDKAR